MRRAIRLDALLRKLPGRISRLLMRVDEAVYFYRAHKVGILVWLLIGVFNHMSSVSAFVLMGIALGVGMQPGEYFVLVPVILIVSAVPIAPNGWGVGEALFRQLFGVYGAANLPPGTLDPQRIMGTRAVALSVCYRIHSTLWSLMGGLMSLYGKDRVTRAEVEAEVAGETDWDQ